MENRQYLSVMTVAMASGDIGLSLTTYDSLSNITIIANITGISSGLSEEKIAIALYNQLSTIVYQYGAQYSGIPSLIEDGPAATFRLTRTNHVLGIFSESQYTIEVTDNETGASFYIDEDPMFLTENEASSLATLLGVDYSSFTTDQIIQLIAIGSGEIVAYTNNPIVLSTYNFQHWGNWEESVQLDMTPVQYVDPPFTRRPNIFSFLTQDPQGDPLNVYSINSKTGWISYRYAQDVFNAYEPFDDNNEWRISYIAGEKTIPSVVKKAVVLLSSLAIDSSNGNITSLQGGTFKVGYATNKETLAYYLLPIQQFIIV